MMKDKDRVRDTDLPKIEFTLEDEATGLVTPLSEEAKRKAIIQETARRVWKDVKPTGVMYRVSVNVVQALSRWVPESDFEVARELVKEVLSASDGELRRYAKKALLIDAYGEEDERGGERKEPNLPKKAFDLGVD